MRFTYPDNRTLTAFGLLAVFVVGGLLMPALHRAHHGLAWADLRGDTSAAEACDHSRHGDGFEATLPDFHNDLCALCHRHELSVEGLWSQSSALLLFGTYEERVVSSPVSVPFFDLLIRGPPVV
ncbi:MAG TPA: hypothetical protein VKP65_23120 [Rhodothermales bacterium]|nr:hypothetical protein [Rhodothermales bacterium]